MRLRAAILFVLAFTALILVVPAARPATSRAAGPIAFSDAHRGWRLTIEGFVSYARPGKAVLWRTSNGGASWKQVAAGKPGTAADGTVTPGLLTFRGATTGLWGRTFWSGTDLPWLRAVDAGTRWTAAPDPVRVTLADIGFAPGTVAWACDYAGGSLSGGTIYRSADGGVTWKASLRLAAKPATTPGDAFVAVAAPTRTIAYVAGKGARLGGLWQTQESGRFWRHRRVPGGSAIAIAFPSATTGWAIGPSGGISMTTDGGVSWTTQLASTGRHLSSIAFTDLEHGWAAGEEGALARTTDGGATWEWLDAGTEAWLHDLVFTDATHGWMTYKDYTDPSAPADLLLRTTDGGVTWQRL
jgi:photosystem II stability/assembly factor-like uncharacterized protein